MTHGAITTDRSAADAHRIAISYTLNGEPVSCEVDARTLLVHHLREERNLTGTHIGCDTSQCGACAVHIDGRAAKSCTVLAVQVDGCEVTTIEGVRGQSSGRSASQSKRYCDANTECNAVSVPPAS